VTAGASCNRKVDHLNGKDENCHEPGQRRGLVIELGPRSFEACENTKGRECNKSNRNRQIDESIRNVQEW
jgi:hypothetical protein